MSTSKTILAALFVIFVPNLILAEPLALTDKTWKDMLCGQWMVEFYAPWCPSCEHFKSTWAKFSDAMISKDIKVAAIDIDKYPSLSGRFRISVLPTIYYVRDGIFREFHGERSLNGLKNYIEFEEWQRTQPVRSYFAPDSISMSLVSSIFDVSVLVKDAYNLLHDQYGWPAWLIYVVFAVAVIILGLGLGFGVLMLIDYCVNISPNDYSPIPDDSRDGGEFDESETQSIKSAKRSKVKSTVPASPTLVASSTPHRPATVPKNRSLPVVEIQDDEALLDEVLAADQNDDGSEDLEASDVSHATDDDADQELKKTTTTATVNTIDNDQSLHRRRTNKK